MLNSIKIFKSLEIPKLKLKDTSVPKIKKNTSVLKTKTTSTSVPKIKTKKNTSFPLALIAPIALNLNALTALNMSAEKLSSP